MQKNRSLRNDSGKQPNAGQEKMRKIQQILTKARLATNLPAYDDKELQVAAAAWLEILELVASDWLNECYIRAMRAHDPEKPFTAGEIIRAWSGIVASGEYDVTRLRDGVFIAEGERFCPHNCSMDGFITVEGDGTDNNPADYTYAQCCPIHRSEGVPKNPNHAPWNNKRRAGRRIDLYTDL